MVETRSCVVIGAGIAGLAAAGALRDAGADVLVLEAGDRPGGRTRTEHHLGPALDLGASWLHGVDAHPLKDLADSLGLDTVITDYEEAELLNTGGRVDTTDWALFDAYIEDVYAAADRAGPAVSVAQAAASISREAHPEVDETTREVLLKLFIEEDYAADAADLSAAAMEEGEDFTGEDALIRQGYSAIVNALAAGLDIRTNCVVSAVDYRGEQVEIRYGEETVCADSVLITVPLGVLQAGDICFQPPLPGDKQEAIRQLGMGLLNKLYLRFPRAFWPDGLHAFTHRAVGRAPWASWFNMMPLTGEPILMGFNAGSNAAQIETLSDTEIVAEAVDSLRTLFGTDVPEPEDYLLSRWGSDPFARGAYSYLPPGVDPEARADLVRPVEGRLYFAGEATHRDFPASTQGAYLSGLDQAQRMLSAGVSGPTGR